MHDFDLGLSSVVIIGTPILANVIVVYRESLSLLINKYKSIKINQIYKSECLICAYRHIIEKHFNFTP